MASLITNDSACALIVNLIDTKVSDLPTAAEIDAAVSVLPEVMLPAHAGGAHYWRTLDDAAKARTVLQAIRTQDTVRLVNEMALRFWNEGRA